METNSFFDINRLKYLILRDFSINYKTMLIAFGAITGFLMFIGTVTILVGNKSMDEKGMLGMILPTLILAGFISTSMVFSELNSPHRGYLYLTLPASAFEKLISSWLATSLFYVIFSIVLLFILNIYYIIIATSFTSQSIPLINILSLEVLKPFGIYMVVQSVFLLGAIYFRRVNFLKTLLAFFVVVIIISIYSGFLGKILLNKVNFEMQQIGPGHGGMYFRFINGDQIELAAKFLFWFALAPFFLTVSYFRLKERQV